MNDFNFDLDLFIEAAKKCGATVTEGTGQITINGKPLTSQKLSDIMSFELNPPLIDAHELWCNIQMLPHNGDMISSTEVEEEIMNAPQIEAEIVRHGRWIKNEIESEKHVEPIFYCSACENWEAWGHTELTNYCPYCGAKMDEEAK